MHRRSPPAEGVLRRHRRRHRQTADRLRLPCADHELSGAGHADDRADRIGIEGGARSLLRRHDRDPATRSPRSKTAAGRSRPRRCATRRTPCTTSPTMPGRAPIAAPRAASRRAPRGPTNTGARSGASTMSMATATWCARARRSRITRRRRSDAQLVMPGLDPGIHQRQIPSKEMDCRVKPGNDIRIKQKRALKTSATQRPQRPSC